MTTLTLKLDECLKKDAHKLADDAGISLSSLVKMLLKNAIRRGGFCVDTKINAKYYVDSKNGDKVFEDSKEAVKYFDELAELNDDQIKKIL